MCNGGSEIGDSYILVTLSGLTDAPYVGLYANRWLYWKSMFKKQNKWIY